MTFGVMYDHTFLNLQITRSDIRPHIKWALILVIVYGHFNLPSGVCVGMNQLNILTLSPRRVFVDTALEDWMKRSLLHC